MTSYPDFFNDTVIYEEEYPLLMPTWGYVASAFALFLIGFFGFFLNLMVILLMFKDRKLWTPLNIILFNLVCSDFSVSVLGNPFTLISALFHRWVFGKTMCVLYGFFMALLGITSITTLTVISFERYLLVTRPLSSRHLSSKGAVVAICFIWSYSLALTTPPLIGWGNYVNEAANISCSVNWHEQSRNTLTYIMFLFAMGQIIPLSIITFSYVNIIRTLRETSQRLGRVNRAEAHATAMVFTMIIAFTIAWTPYSLFALMEQFATEGIVSPGVGVIPALVAKSSICYDPLIYVGMNHQFRQSIKTIFGSHTKERDSNAEKINNTQVTPAHKLSSNRPPSTDRSQQLPKKPVSTDSSGTTNYDVQKVTKSSELVAVQEINASDTERSSDLFFDDESSSRKNEPFGGESCGTIKDESPILTYIDSERLLFSKPKKDIEENVFGNFAYEDHPTDDMAISFDVEDEYSNRKSKIISHSCSYDFERYPSEKKRKLSVETKLEIQPKGFLRDALGKLFEHDTTGSDCVKSYLCDGKIKKDEEDP